MTYTIHSQARRKQLQDAARARAFGLLLMGLVTISVLVAAIVQAVQGDWAPAIFLAIIWAGLKTTRTSND